MNLTLKIILLLCLTVAGIFGAVASAVFLKKTLQSAPKKLTKAEKKRLPPRKPGEKSPKKAYAQRLRRFITSLALSSAVTLAAGGYCGYLVYIHAAPPADYIKTDIFIEESGYQDERFTADGVVYVALPLEPEYYVCMEKKTAVFSYKPKGFLNGHLWGNYFAIHNEHGFDLVWNGMDRLFAPADQATEIVDFYRTDTEKWYLLDYDSPDENGDPGEVSLSREAVTAIRAYLELDVSSLAQTTAIAEDGYDTVEVWAESNDGIVIFNYWFVVIEGKVYLHLGSATTQQDQEEMTLAILPDEIGAPLAALVKETDQ